MTVLAGTSITFVDKSTAVPTVWLQDINNAVYGKIPTNFSLATDFTGVDPTGVADSTVGLQAAITAASGKTLYLPPGTYKITGTLTLPQSIHIMGPTMRGTGAPSGTIRGAYINAAFAGPALEYAPGGFTAGDILLEHFQLGGNYLLYGAGNGIHLNNTATVLMRNLVVFGFGTDQIHIDSGCYSCLVKDTYVAETWGVGGDNAGIYCNGQQCTFDGVESDGHKYAIFIDAIAYDTNITGGVLEGSTVSIINIAASATGNNRISLVRLNGTVSGAGITTASSYTTIEACKIRITPGTIGVDLVTNGGFGAILANNVIIAPTSIRLNGSGLCYIGGNSCQSSSKALEIVANSLYASEVVGNWFGGTTNSVLHTAGTAITFTGNRYDDGTGVYKAIVITAGSPTLEAVYGGATPTVASVAALVLPAGVNGAFISGVTNITSLGVVGFTNRTVTLIFQGILTFTDGSNLKLAGNFVTTADDTITLFCDGTNWYEVARSVN